MLQRAGDGVWRVELKTFHHLKLYKVLTQKSVLNKITLSTLKATIDFYFAALVQFPRLQWLSSSLICLLTLSAKLLGGRIYIYICIKSIHILHEKPSLYK